MCNCTRKILRPFIFHFRRIACDKFFTYPIFFIFSIERGPSIYSSNIDNFTGIFCHIFTFSYNFRNKCAAITAYPRIIAWCYMDGLISDRKNTSDSRKKFNPRIIMRNLSKPILCIYLETRLWENASCLFLNPTAVNCSYDVKMS